MENFRRLGLSEETIEVLKQRGFTEPTAIQTAAIPLLLSGEHDVVGQAQTGTGKTAAFALPIIETLTPGARTPHALILSPTRELCMQLAGEFHALCGPNRPFKVAALYGGQAIEFQLRDLKHGVDIAVGTPGRVLDLIERGALALDEVRFAVLDEADEMLDMGFIEDIEAILARTPGVKRMLMFSATMPEPIMQIAQKFMHDPEIVNVRTEATNAGLTRQLSYEVRREDKAEALWRLIEQDPGMYAMVFCRTRADVDELTEKLHFRRCRVEALHGEISQAQRTRVIESFKRRQFSILIATDVAARGIDVNDLTHVINYSLPHNAEAYVHRIGRTGRAGHVGTAITFVTPGERRRAERIEQEIDLKFERCELPDAAAIIQGKLRALSQRLEAITAKQGEQDSYLAPAGELLAERAPETVVAALLRDAYGNSFEAASFPPIGRRERERALRSEKSVRLFFARGKADGFTATAILDFIYERTRIRSRMLGKIDCMAKFSYLSVPESLVPELMSKINDRSMPHLLEFAREVSEPENGPHDAVAAERPPRRKRRDEAVPEKAGRPVRPKKPAERPKKTAEPPVRRNSFRELREELTALPLKEKRSKKHRQG